MMKLIAVFQKYMNAPNN